MPHANLNHVERAVLPSSILKAIHCLTSIYLWTKTLGRKACRESLQLVLYFLLTQEQSLRKNVIKRRLLYSTDSPNSPSSHPLVGVFFLLSDYRGGEEAGLHTKGLEALLSRRDISTRGITGPSIFLVIRFAAISLFAQERYSDAVVNRTKSHVLITPRRVASRRVLRNCSGLSNS